VLAVTASTAFWRQPAVRRSVGEVAWHAELLAQPGGVDAGLASA
jgi:hypothetical protein